MLLVLKRLALILLLASFAHAQFTASVYVDAVLGNDANSGTTIGAPLLTIAQAKTVVHSLCAAATAPLIVALRGSQSGSYTPAYTYYQAGTTLTFIGSTTVAPPAACTGDSGKSNTIPIIWQSYPSELAAISGGQRVTSWTTTGYSCVSSDCTQYKVNCPQGVSCNFEQLWYNTVRRFKPEVGATDGSNMGTYMYESTTGDTNANAIVLPTDPCSLANTYGCDATTNANCNKFGANGCWDRIRVSNTGAFAGQWATINAAVASAPNLAVPDNASNTGASCGIEVWIAEEGSYPYMCLRAWDNTNGIMIFCQQSGATTCNGGTNVTMNQGLPSFGPLTKHRFIIKNVLDSGGHHCTLPQQWCLDRTVSPPVIYYNACNSIPACGVIENPNTDVVEIPVNPQAVLIYNTRFLIFRNLLFEHDNFPIPSTGYISLGGEPTLPGAVSVQSSDTKFEFDTFAHTVGDALEFFPCRFPTGNPNVDPAWCDQPGGTNTSTATYISSATSSGSYVQHSSFYDVGGSPINPGGKTIQGAGDNNTDTNVVNNLTISDNLLDGYGRFIVHAFGISLGAANNIWITNNEIHHGYHTAINLCTGTQCFWGVASSHGDWNINLSGNLIYSILQGVGNDFGALHMATAYGSNASTGGCGSGIRVIGNIVHDVSGPNSQPHGENGSNNADGIYDDNQTCLTDIEYNLVYRAGDYCYAALFGTPWQNIAGGGNATGPILFNNNVGAYCRTAGLTSGTPWMSTGDSTCPASHFRREYYWTNGIIYLDRYYGSSPVTNFVAGCADSCGQTYSGYNYFSGNFWSNINGGVSSPISSDVNLFHVTTATAGNVTTGCATAVANWSTGTFAQWQTGATNTGGVPVVEPIEDVTGMPAGPGGLASANGAISSASVFQSAGYPNDNYRVTGSTGTPFNASLYNSYVAAAGRLSNTSFNPVVLDTFPTSSWDPSHTNNGDY